MGNNEKGRRVGGLKLDPAVSEFLNGAARNKAAMSKHEQADAARITLRIDIPQWLKERILGLAEREQVSVSNAACLVLAYALANDDGAIALFAAENKVAIRSLNAPFEIDLSDLQYV